LIKLALKKVYMKYVIASDHAGFELKEAIKEYIKAYGEVEDLGCYSKDRVDYPDYAAKVCDAIKNDSEIKGVLICGTGIGISMAANRYAHIRAALCHDAFTGEMARAHNDANVLCMGARVVGIGTAESIVKAFCTTSFEGGRHSQRLCKF
jgi:ribose 5-phosphate isomerase B